MRTELLQEALLDLGETEVSDSDIYRKIADHDPENSGDISFSGFKQIVKEIREQEGGASSENDLLDAYVAMGGDKDGGGAIDSNMLVRTIRDEFEMTIDIEALIAEADEDGSGEIEFDEFRDMLQGRVSQMMPFDAEESD